jgi:manganese/zinc/iron transport system substrate-binding protein
MLPVLRSPCHLFWGLVLTLSVALPGCRQGDSQPGFTATTFSADRPLKVFCTTGQVTDAIRHLVGDDAEVVGVMGPGVDPHLYQALPSDIVALKQADIVFYNGLHLEGRMAETLKSFANRKPVIAMAERLVEQQDIRLRKPSEFEGYYDPHIWHDVRLWADCIDYAAERLAEFDPAHADEYRSRAASYRKTLEELDEHCRTQIATIPEERRVLVTTHDAFGYFSAAYGLEAIGLKGISTDDEADFQHIDEVRELLVSRKIPAVFVESSTPPSLMRQLVELCANSGHRLHVGLSDEDELYADALGPPNSGADTYEGMIRANVDRIVRGLTAGL